MSAVLWSGKFREPLHCSVCIGEPYWSCHNFAPISRRKRWNIRTVKEPEHLFHSRPWKSKMWNKKLVQYKSRTWCALRWGERRNEIILFFKTIFLRFRALVSKLYLPKSCCAVSSIQKFQDLQKYHQVYPRERWIIKDIKRQVSKTFCIDDVWQVQEILNQRS